MITKVQEVFVFYFFYWIKEFLKSRVYVRFIFCFRLFRFGIWYRKLYLKDD